MKGNFFSLSIRQPINQWLCIGLICAWTLWVVVYYVHNGISNIVADNAHAQQQLNQK